MSCVWRWCQIRRNGTRDHLTVEVVYNGRVVYSRGPLWIGSPCSGFRDGIDGPAARAAVLDLVAMAPGDTDADYFAGYTDEQREWASHHAAAIGLERLRWFGEA